MAKKNDWVRVHVTVLAPDGRAAAVPDDTKQVPLEMFVKGHLLADAEIGADCEIVTKTGRRVFGKLLEVNPHYTHSYGDYVPEIERAGDEIVAALFGGAEK